MVSMGSFITGVLVAIVVIAGGTVYLMDIDINPDTPDKVCENRFGGSWDATGATTNTQNQSVLITCTAPDGTDKLVTIADTKMLKNKTGGEA